MSRRAPIHLVLAGLLGLGACQARLSPTQREQIRIWFLCEECDAGERQRVEGIGNRAVPTLAMALRQGPSAAGRANVEAQLRAQYAGMTAPPLPEAEFVALFLGNYVTTVRTRAALSLGDIGTPEAIAELDAAAAVDLAGTDTLPSATRLAVHTGIAAALPPFSGIVSDTVVAALDTVVVFRGTAGWDGDETVSLRGAPFPDDLLLLRDPDSLVFVVAAPPGTYRLVILNEPGGSTQIPLRITAKPYQGHDEGGAPDIAYHTLPRTLFLSLAPAAIGDTIDFFRINIPAQAGGRVEADWVGPGNVDLEWRACPGQAPVNAGLGATANRPEQLLVQTSVLGPECRLILVALRDAPRAAELIRLTISVP